MPSGDGDGTCKAICYHLCYICESLCHEFGEDRADSYLVVCGNCQDWSNPEKVRPSTRLLFICNWIISMIVFVADIVHQALAKISCSCAAMVYHCKISIDSLYRFQTQLPTEIWEMVAWLLAMDRFTCPPNSCEVSSKFFSCLLIILTINSGVQVSICSDRNCGSYLLDILLWYMTNGNER